jgi:transglutaminase-like putative cysteine protease
MTVLRVVHNTTYQYRAPVELGEHRLMSRPRDSHDLRLLDTTLLIDPPASSIRWIHDVFGNSIALVLFDRPSDKLVFESGFRAEHYPVPPQQLELDAYAARLPFSYPAAEALDLGHTKERHYPDPEHRIDSWARAIVDQSDEAGTLAVLEAMTAAIKEQFDYVVREAAGVQSPLETLDLGSGSCRDFAVFMMEAVRSVGLAARFVSGYLYDQSLVNAAGGLVGGGATHAWLQVYLPGAGWVELDPTNALVGGSNLIRVAVARDASQAAPLTGTFNGKPDDLLSMTVSVQVTTE